MENPKTNCFISNTPIIDEETYGIYCDLLYSKVKEEGVNNIGLIAPYGAGKSSLIKTFLNKFYKKTENRILSISLANFNSNKNESDDNVNESTNSQTSACLCDIDQKVEKSILQQIVFKKNKSQLAQSRIHRIGNNWKNALIITMLVMLTLISLTFFSTEMANCALWSFRYSKIVFLVSTLVLLSGLIFYLIYFEKLKKISLKGVDINVDIPYGGSVLNYFIDEILYYFSKTKTTIVIVEDLDRFDNLDYFSKLRELNFIINNSDMIKHKVTFIYAVGDTMFTTSEDRAKFFDFIISLTPQMSSNNAKDLISSKMNKVCTIEQLLPADFIQEISFFVTERRTLNNTINDYKLYYDILHISQMNDTRKNLKLFSLMLYKNLNPDDFAKLQFNQGVIANIFKNLNNLKKTKNQKESDNIIELEKLIQIKSEDILNSEETLRQLLDYIIIKHGSQSYYYSNNAKSVNSCDLKSIDYNTLLKSSDNNRVLQLSEIKKYLTFDYDKIVKQLNTIDNTTIKELKIKIETSKNLISKISNMTLCEYCENYSSEEVLSEIDNELIHLLLINGFIEEDFMDYISLIGNDILQDNDRQIAKRILAKVKPIFSEKINNPINLAQSVDLNRFESQHVLYFDLVEAVLSNITNAKTNLKEKRTLLIKQLSLTSDITTNFIIDYIANNRNIELIFKCLIKYKQDLWDMIYHDESLSIEIKNLCLTTLINIGNDDILIGLNSNKSITLWINKLSNPYDVLKNISNEKLALLTNEFNLHLENIVCKDEEQSIAKNICKNCAFELNISNLEFITSNFINSAKSLRKVSMLTHILDNKDFFNDNFVENNLENIVNILINNYDYVINDEEVIYQVLLANIPTKLKEEFLNKEKTKINYNGTLEKKLLIYAYNNNNIIANWENIVIGVNEKTFSCSDIQSFIENNSDKLSESDLIHTENDTLEQVLGLTFKVIDNLNTLCNSFHFKINYGAVGSDLNRCILILNNKIEFTEENFIASANSKHSFYAYIKNYASNCIPLLSKMSFNSNFNDSIEFLLLQNDIHDKIKIKILEKINKYVPKTEETIKTCCGIILDNYINLNNSALIIKIFETNSIELEDKILMLIRYCKILSDEQIKSFITTINQVYSDIINGNLKKVKKILVDEKIMYCLKNKGIIDFKLDAWNYNIK